MTMVTVLVVGGAVVMSGERIAGKYVFLLSWIRVAVLLWSVETLGWVARTVMICV